MRRFIGWLLAIGLVALSQAAWAQTGYDRRGGDYLKFEIKTGDPAICAARCERDSRCRAWAFSYPRTENSAAICWLKNKVTPRTEATCCVSGVRGAGVIEPTRGPVEYSIDRVGGDYRSFDLKSGEGDEACKLACTAENKCRAWTYVRAGYVGRQPHCFLKKEIKPPRRRPGFISGVVR